MSNIFDGSRISEDMSDTISGFLHGQERKIDCQCIFTLRKFLLTATGKDEYILYNNGGNLYILYYYSYCMDNNLGSIEETFHTKVLVCFTAMIPLLPFSQIINQNTKM